MNGFERDESRVFLLLSTIISLVRICPYIVDKLMIYRYTNARQKKKSVRMTKGPGLRAYNPGRADCIMGLLNSFDRHSHGLRL